MIPLRDTIPSQRVPFVTWTLIAVCVAVFGYQFVLNLHSTGRMVVAGRRARPETLGDRFVERWGAIPSVVVRGYVDRAEISRGFFVPQRVVEREPRNLKQRTIPLLTSLFLHGSLLHLAMSMLFLYVFGDNVEDRLGHAGFLLFYLGGGVVATLAHVASAPSSPIPVVGASGAISAVLGAYFLLFPRAWILTWIPFFLPIFIEVPALLFLGFWFVSQVTNVFGGVAGATGGGIAWWAHIGGFVFGVTLAFYNYGKWRTPRRRYTSAEPF